MSAFFLAINHIARVGEKSFADPDQNEAQPGQQFLKMVCKIAARVGRRADREKKKWPLKNGLIEYRRHFSSMNEQLVHHLTGVFLDFSHVL